MKLLLIICPQVYNTVQWLVCSKLRLRQHRIVGKMHDDDCARLWRVRSRRRRRSGFILHLSRCIIQPNPADFELFSFISLLKKKNTFVLPTNKLNNIRHKLRYLFESLLFKYYSEINYSNIFSCVTKWFKNECIQYFSMSLSLRSHTS